MRYVPLNRKIFDMKKKKSTSRPRSHRVQEEFESVREELNNQYVEEEMKKIYGKEQKTDD
jgi:hypothetical protein